MRKPVGPALRYLGGKSKLAPWIISHLPPHDFYTEAYGGGASVLLQKPRARSEVYNDLDEEVVNLFKVLRDAAKAAELERLVRLTPFARQEWEGCYEPSEDQVERARRMLVRSFQGFGSCASRSDRTTGWRTGRRLDSASAARDWSNYPDRIAALTDRLRGVSYECRPALEVLTAYDSPGVVHYVDPPYVHETRSRMKGRVSPTNGYRYEMTDGDHVELLERLQSLRGSVVLSGYQHPLYDDALSNWRRLTKATHADGARARSEVLWINPAACDAHGLFGAVA